MGQIEEVMMEYIYVKNGFLRMAWVSIKHNHLELMK